MKTNEFKKILNGYIAELLEIVNKMDDLDDLTVKQDMVINDFCGLIEDVIDDLRRRFKIK